MRALVVGLGLSLVLAGCGDDVPAAHMTTSGSMDAGVDAAAPVYVDRPFNTDASTQVALMDGALVYPDPGADYNDVCPGNDKYEPNNDLTAASPLTLDGTGQVVVGAAVQRSDLDWYTFVSPKSDPASVSLDYAVGTKNSTVELQFTVYDAMDNEVAGDSRVRTSAAQSLAATFETTQQGHFFIRVENSEDFCTGYSLKIDTAICTDNYEDNDVASSAAVVTLDEKQTALVSASVDGYDADFYQVVATKNDPLRVVATYAHGDNGVELAFEVQDTSGATLPSATVDAPSANGPWAATWEAATGASYLLHVTSNVAGACTSYALTVDGAFCSDIAEDDDTAMTAAAIPAVGSALSVSKLDADYYRAPATAGGRCTVQYAAGAQTLHLTLLGAGDALIADGGNPVAAGSMQTLSVTWAATDSPTVLRVLADDPECTSYTLNCS